MGDYLFSNFHVNMGDYLAFYLHQLQKSNIYIRLTYLLLLRPLSLEVKQLGHEADHSPPSSAKVKE
jgi:hypothetical protein